MMSEQKRCPICNAVLVKEPYGPGGCYICRCPCGYKEVLAWSTVSKSTAKAIAEMYKKK